MQCKECGANLPENARYCLQCGTTVGPDPSTEQPGQKLDFVQPALSGGMLLGFLSSMPIVGIFNCICCMWVLLGGGVATVLLTRQRPAGVTFGDGAFVGALSGLFGAVVSTIVFIPAQLISKSLFGSQEEQLEKMLSDFGVEGATRELILRMGSGELSVETILIKFVSDLLMYALFAMLGGILTAAILNKQKGTRGLTPRPPQV